MELLYERYLQFVQLHLNRTIGSNQWSYSELYSNVTVFDLTRV